MLKLVRIVFAWSGLVLASTWANPASAHINMAGALMSRGGDQKMSPCDGAKGDGPTYTFEPGTTIKLQLAETVPHPSYFRIAFDDDGDNGFIEPASIKPIETTRACPFNADDQCGEADYCNVVSATGATVLWDNLNPHRAAMAKDMTWNVKLPDIECENCTIQIIQVMEDTVHGAYCPQGSCANAGSSLEDIYHRCIDIKLKRGATNSPGATTEPVSNMGMDCSATPGAAGSGGVGAAGSAAGSAGTAAAGAGGSAAGASAAGAGGMPGRAGTSGGTAAIGGIAGTPSGTAGVGASGTAARPSGAGSGAAMGGAGSSVGMTTRANTQTGAAGSATSGTPPSPKDSGGCSITRASGGSKSLATFAWFGFGAALVRMTRRRRRAWSTAR